MRIPRWRSIAAVTVLAALSAFGSARQYRNEAARIGNFEVPRDWQMAPQLAYPKLLVVATSKDGARLVLGTQRVVPGTTSVELAADARAVFLKKGLGEPHVAPLAGERDRSRLDTIWERGGARNVLRQVYVVDGDLEVVISLTAPIEKQADALREFDKAVETLELMPFAPPPPPVESLNRPDGGTQTP